jgi:hypothetical protein
MSESKQQNIEDSFYSTEAKTILLMPEEEKQKILTGMIKNIDMRREDMNQEIQKIQILSEKFNDPDHELYNPDFYEIISGISTDLYNILWIKTYK